MAIDKKEIEKYIFDPKKPKQCDAYKLLLNISKKEPYAYFSPDFLKYFFKDEIITDNFKSELWNIPDNYDDLNSDEKFNIFKNNNSSKDLEEFIRKIKLNENRLKNLKFYSEHVNLIRKNERKYSDNGYLTTPSLFEFEDSFCKYKLINDTFVAFDSLINEYTSISVENKSKNYLFFSLNYLDILIADVDKVSLLITLEKNIDDVLEFLKFKEGNIKPLFLKKEEDIDVLLNVLEEDLRRENKKNIEQDTISTLDEITIKNFFSIKDFKLNNLVDKKEIYIVGENGDGKSLLLQAIAVGLKGTQEDGLKEFRAIEDKYTIDINNKEDCQNNFFAYGSSRNNYCQIKEDITGYLSLFSSEYDLKSPTKWLQYLDYSEQKENDHVISVKEAKKLLQHLLNSDIEIDVTPDKVAFLEKGSEVSFEQLSAGYRGVITIVCDLIARLSEKQKVERISDFQGIVLIDEIELHLHPKWQYNFIKNLRDTFPLIQFIVTTHSPTVIQGASDEAVYYQMSKDDGVSKISEVIENKNDFLNDIQSDIFGFDVNRQKLDNPNMEKHKKSKDALLNLINTIEEKK